MISGWNISYVACILISLYTFYLLIFKTYETKLGKKTEKRALLPNIVYLILFVVIFIPIVNIVFCAGFYFYVLIDDNNDIMVDSWLFRKPGQKNETLGKNLN